MKDKLLENQEKIQNKIKDQLDSEEINFIKSLQKCKKDNDCKKDEYCAFNENNNNHYCIPNKIYLGCLKNPDSMNRFLKATDKKYSENMDSCIDFARKLNNNEVIYDYIHFRPKVETPIKKQSINVDLKCGDMKIINLPYEDSFKEDCDISNENCKVIPKDNIKKILQNNVNNCKKNYHLNINYSCDVENIDKNIKVDLNKDNTNVVEGKLEFKLNCPVYQGKNKDNKYESQCTLFSFKDQDNIDLDTMFDSNIPQAKCNYDSYLIPNIINDMNEYNLKKNKKLEKSVESFNDIINADQEELNKKKALQYMIEYEKKFNTKISYNEALEYIKSTIEHATSQLESTIWDTTKGANKIPFENNNTNYTTYQQIGVNKLFNDITELLDFVNKTYTPTTYPDYIVYFGNSVNNITNSKKAYAISFEELKSKNKVESTSWINNIINGGGPTFTIINTSPMSSTKRANYFSDLAKISYQDVQTEFDNSLQKLQEYQIFEEQLIDDKNNEVQKNINYMNQRIKNSNYQSDMNKKIIRYLYILLILVFIITLIYFVYMNQLSSQIFIQ